MTPKSIVQNHCSWPQIGHMWVGWVLTVGRYRVGQLHQALPMMIQEVEVFGTQYEDFCAGWPVALLMV